MGASENVALLTGGEVRECPACLDAGKHEPLIEMQGASQAGPWMVRCKAWHRYRVRTRARYPDGHETYALACRL